MEVPIEKRWRILCDICRSFYFSWREVVKEEVPKPPLDLALKFWEKQGHKTAEYHLRKGINRERVLEDVIYAIRNSCIIMGKLWRS